MTGSDDVSNSKPGAFRVVKHADRRDFLLFALHMNFVSHLHLL